MVTSRFFSLRVSVVALWLAVLFTFLYIPQAFRWINPTRSINVFMWSGVVAPEMFKRFEEQTGIRVNVSYYEGNEELLVKLLATKGKGYDLIVPSEYNIKFLVEHHLLKKLDKTKLNFLDKINPKFTGHYFDPYNTYSIPAEWYFIGFAVDKTKFPDGLPAASWDTIFKPQDPIRLSLINDSRELSSLAIHYLLGELCPLTVNSLDRIVDLLKKQKPFVEAYSDFRGDFLLESGNCSVALMFFSHIAKTLQTNENLAFLVPEEWTFLGIENYAIPAASTKEDLVYELLNFLLSPEVQKYNFENAMSLPVRADADYLFNAPVIGEYARLLHPTSTYKMVIFKNMLTDQQVNHIWLSVKGGL